MLTRSEKILEAAIREYILHGDPVASEALHEKYNFGVKPASIRAELLRLTHAGFLEQPHTSGGRVPTEKGYEFFVDRIREAIFNQNSAAAIAPAQNLAEPMLDDLAERRLNEFVSRFAKEVKTLSLGYAPDEHRVYKSGLEELCSAMEFEGRNEFLEIVRDFERLDESLSRLGEALAGETGPQVFIGSRSPITKSPRLSVIADACEIDGAPFFIVAIGPTRMNYAKPLKIMKALRGKRSNK